MCQRGNSSLKCCSGNTTNTKTKVHINKISITGALKKDTKAFSNSYSCVFKIHLLKINGFFVLVWSFKDSVMASDQDSCAEHLVKNTSSSIVHSCFGPVTEVIRIAVNAHIWLHIYITRIDLLYKANHMTSPLPVVIFND